MYVAQSVRLIDEFEATLIKLGVKDIIKIHSETSSNVVKDVVDVLERPARHDRRSYQPFRVFPNSLLSR